MILLLKRALLMKELFIISEYLIKLSKLPAPSHSTLSAEAKDTV